jgi:hypothetical protein
LDAKYEGIRYDLNSDPAIDHSRMPFNLTVWDDSEEEQNKEER